MSQELFSNLVSGVRTYRRYVVNPSIKGMVQYLKDAGYISSDDKIMSGTAERLWSAAV